MTSTETEVDNPYSGALACTVRHDSAEQIDRALNRARHAREALRATPLQARIEVLEKSLLWFEQNSQRVSADITAMMGKPLVQAQGELSTMVARARALIEIAPEALAARHPVVDDDIRRVVTREPLGVVLDLPAWNYPLLTAINVVAGDILTGNPVLLKHAPRSPLCGEHFREAFAWAAAAEGMLQVLHCDHASTEKLASDPRVDHVVFTGSPLGGRRISEAAAGRCLQFSYELGGNDAAYIAEDADLARATEGLVDGAIYNAGQSCCAVERVLVHEKHYGEFLERARPLCAAYVMGDPLAEETTLGPIAQPYHPAELKALVEDAIGRGARLLSGGACAQASGHGRFFEATLLAEVGPDCRLMREECFGPILAVRKVRSDEEAVSAVNESPYGLTASIWTADRQRAEAVAGQLHCGTVFMNRCDFVDPYQPWVGVKESGSGASLGIEGLQALTRPRSLHLRD